MGREEKEASKKDVNPLPHNYFACIPPRNGGEF
jgi:hypothetical protein